MSLLLLFETVLWNPLLGSCKQLDYKMETGMFSMWSVPSYLEDNCGDPVSVTRVEAGSNTSTVTLRVVGGDEKGSLKSEIVIGTRTRERLRSQGLAAYTKDRPVLSSERAPHKKQDRNC
jgi:hypothetical protein